jgi:hypothetical protein
MRYSAIIFSLLIFICSCRNYENAQSTSLKLTMKMQTMIAKPCINYTLDIESNGKIAFVKDCSYLEGNKEFESQLSEMQIKQITEEIEKADFFSFKDDYSYDSKNCPATATDMSSVILTIKFDEKEKTINHYHGCFVKSWFSEENALQPLNELENKIDEIVETKRWIGERK